MKRSVFIAVILFLFAGTGIRAQHEKKHLVILHVNDTHSRIEPLPATDSRNPDQGGVIRVSAYIDSVRRENPLTLVFHAGDYVQGTPYFNIFKGEVEIALMNQARFDAACIGNHEFDYGFPVMKDMFRQARFPIIASNYDFSQTPLKGLTKDFLIIKKKGLKIGVLGIGVDPDGLIAKANYEGMRFLSPVETANKIALYLKEKQKCNLVVCLSHLGYQSDLELAPKTRNIDVIIGGHSHTFLTNPYQSINSEGKEVIITQMGKNGIYVGRLDIIFQEKEKK